MTRTTLDLCSPRLSCEDKFPRERSSSSTRTFDEYEPSRHASARRVPLRLINLAVAAGAEHGDDRAMRSDCSPQRLTRPLIDMTLYSVIAAAEAGPTQHHDAATGRV